MDLTGGGLLRSAGGWEGVKVLKEEKVYQMNDERILGDGTFVERVLASAEEAMEKRYALRSEGLDLEGVASRPSEVLSVKPEDVRAAGKHRFLWEQLWSWEAVWPLLLVRPRGSRQAPPL